MISAAHFGVEILQLMALALGLHVKVPPQHRNKCALVASE